MTARSPTTTTLYLNDGATGTMTERVTSGSTTTWRTYIAADGKLVAERFVSGSTVNMRYFVLDHLGSVAVITDENGRVLTDGLGNVQQPFPIRAEGINCAEVLRVFAIEVRMRRLGAGVIAAGLAALAFQPASARPPVQRFVTVTAADSGRTVTMIPRQKLRVVLPVQSGTGYAWQVAPGSTPLLSWNRTRTGVGPAMRGGPRAQMLKFTAMGSGVGLLRLEYRRPWEGAQRAVSVFTLTVSVGPPNFSQLH